MISDFSADFPPNSPTDLQAKLPAQVQSSIESICALGCDRVNEIIDALERGDSIAELNALDKTDQQGVLNELKAIMAVYDRS